MLQVRKLGKVYLKDIIVPEVRGLKKADAEKILKDNNLKMKLSTDGEVITDMTPKPGYTVKEGTEIILHTNTKTKIVIPSWFQILKEVVQR